MRALGVLHDRLTAATAVLGAGCLGLTVLIYCYEIVTRYFLDAPTSWAGAVTLYLLLVSVMLMVPRLTRDGSHVAVTYVTELAGPRFGRLVAGLTDLVSCAVCLATACFAAVETHRAYIHHVNTTDTMEIPTWWLTSFLVYGLVSAGLHFARRAFGAGGPAAAQG